MSGEFKFNSNPITIIGIPDCSNALESIQFVNIPTMNYDEKGSEISIGKDYLSFFNTKDNSNCPVDKCSLKKENCIEKYD